MAVWNLDPNHTLAEFSVRHMMVTTVKGRFEKVSGTVHFDPQNPAASSVEAVIEAASINTGVHDRDNHLRSADFFDVAKYPQITFKSTNIQITGDNEGKITGDLTIHGITRPVTLEVEYFGENVNPYGHTVIGFSAATKINREDFDLTWNVALETGGVLVGKDIKISLDVEAIKIAEVQPA